MKILYLGYYDKDEWIGRRYFALSCKNKMDFIANLISEDNEVIIISLSDDTSYSLARGYSRYSRIDKNIGLFRLGNSKSRFLLWNFFLYIKKQLKFLSILRKYRNKPSKLIVYHSSSSWLHYLMLYILNLRSNTIIEYEESYSRVPGNGISSLFSDFLARKLFNLYIIPNPNLKAELGSEAHYATVYGDMREPVQTDCIFDEKKWKILNNALTNRLGLRLVFSGSLRPDKGVLRAIRLIGRCPKDFELIIAGRGGDKDLVELENVIGSLDWDVQNRIHFVGELPINELNYVLYHCDVGLCTQDADAAYSASSFPSKIITYLTSGLTVLAPSIEAINGSCFAPIVKVYENDEELFEMVVSKERFDRSTIMDYVKSIKSMTKEEVCRLINI